MNWVKKNLKSKDEGLIELGQGLKYAPDPCKLVLDAIEGVNPKGKACVVFLEALMTVEGVNVCGEVRERAKSLALTWRENVNKEGKNPLEVLGFLSFLGCYKLVEEFGKDVVLEFVHIAAKNAKTIKLCRVLGLEEKVPDVVQKLISEGKRLMAVRFASEFKLLDKFSPVELLQSYLKDAKELAQQLRNKGKSCPKSLDQADEREINALKTVLRYIQDFKFESDYPPGPLENRIKRIEELKSNRKRKLPVKPPKTNQKKQKPSRKQAPVTRGVPIPAVNSGISTNVGVSSLPQSQLPYSQPPVLSAGQLGLGSSSIGSYAFSGSMANAPYVDPGNLLYGLASSLVAYANNPSSAGSHLYAPGSQLPSSSYVGPSPSEGYGLLPQQHQPNRPDRKSVV